MELTRRDFLKISAGSILLGGAGVTLTAGTAHASPHTKIAYAKQTTTVCPYCGVGCGIIVHSKDGKVVNTEGDPDHPINQGSLCSKGQSLFQIANNKDRATKVLYRAPGADKWEEKEWDWAMKEIAKRVKDTRDRTFKTTSKVKVPVMGPDKKPMKGPDGKVIMEEKEFTVNRTEAIGSLGGAPLDNEECYVVDKLMRGLGIVYLEQQARL